MTSADVVVALYSISLASEFFECPEGENCLRNFFVYQRIHTYFAEENWKVDVIYGAAFKEDFFQILKDMLTNLMAEDVTKDFY